MWLPEKTLFAIVGSYRAIPREIRRAVAKECEAFILSHIARHLSFAVETTLRTTAAIEQADLAHEKGFATESTSVASVRRSLLAVERQRHGPDGAKARHVGRDRRDEDPRAPAWI
jgi:hypothetical protein